MISLVTLRLLTYLTVILIKGYYTVKGKKRQEEEVESSLYKDWVLAIEEGEKPQVRVCFIKEIKPDGSIIVRAPSKDDKEVLIKWNESKNNFYIESE